MKSKLSWILFVPGAAGAVFFKLAQTIMPDGAIFGLSDMLLNYMAIGCVAVIFLFTLLMCLIDRKISQYYAPHRNIPAGILGLLLAVVCAADGANRIYLSVGAGKIDAFETIEAVLLLLSSVVFIVLGLTHSFVNRDNKHFALFNIMPALLLAIRLVRCFISFTTISITLADICLLAAYIFATLFFFNYAVAISLTEAKHAVKSCFIFGFPAIAALLASGVSAVVTSFDPREMFSNATMVELLLMALYIFAFLLEMTIFIKDRDHVKIDRGDDDAYEQTAVLDAETENTPVITDTDDDLGSEQNDSYLTSQDVNDYLYRVVNKPDGEADNGYLPSEADAAGYLTQESNTPGSQTFDDAGNIVDPNAPGYERRLDEIDKLILEITDDSME